MTSPDAETLLDKRRRLLGPNVRLFYNEPVHLVRGQGAWVWDSDGRRYLDCYNNVPHVGHCHPRVVAAIADQAGQLNTHTRYLHEGILDYAEALTATFGAGLETVLMTCTGSEANDVALRMARAVTGKTGIIATTHTYHGNTDFVSRLSKTSNPPPGGAGDFVRFVPAPDSLRGADPGEFAQEVRAAIEDLEAAGPGFSALLVCPAFVNEGLPHLPPGWLRGAISEVEAAGGLFIADEVQPGFGRLGSHFWGHQYQGVQPHIVTLGKPMANGHPVGAVVTSADTMAAFRSNYSYFNTFGGNPVSCAAANATLAVIEEEGLQEQAATLGAYLRDQLQGLARDFDFIGDTRGHGLIFGLEFVDAAGDPDPHLCQRVPELMRQRGVLINAFGIHKNTLKCRPPLALTRDQADLFLDVLAASLHALNP